MTAINMSYDGLNESCDGVFIDVFDCDVMQSKAREQKTGHGT